MTERHGVTAVVLAGGRSARFGGPKLVALLDGERLLDRTLRAVAAVAAEIVVAGSPLAGEPPDIGRPSGATIRFVPDDERFGGPLAAVAGVLPTLASELAIVVGGDMPALVPAVLEAMLDRLAADPDIDAVVLASATTTDGDTPRTQVLPLVVRVEPASIAATDALRAGDRSLVRLLGRLRSIELPAAEWLALDPAGGTLLDVDIPADLDQFRARDLQ